MTLFVITLTDKFALVSQDTMVAWDTDAKAGHFRTLTPDDLARDPSAFVCNPGAAERCLTFTSKIAVIPHLHMVVGGAGEFRLINAWALNVGVMAARDAVEIDSVAPALLRQVAEKIGGVVPAMIFHVGFDKDARAPVGYFYNRADDFKSTRLLAGSHSMQPIMSVQHPDYRALTAHWLAAVRGDGTENFHVRVAVNQVESYPGAGMGGQLHTARIDAGGISVRVAHEFPGYGEQLDAFREKLGRLPEIIVYGRLDQSNGGHSSPNKTAV